MNVSSMISVDNAVGIARLKHHTYAHDADEALDVIKAEVRELDNAIRFESRERQRAEAMDVIVTCLRFWRGEHLPLHQRSAWTKD